MIRRDILAGALQCISQMARRVGLRGILYRVNHLTKQRRYQRWLAAYDTYSERELTKFHKDVSGLLRNPLISIVVPVYNTPASCLTEMIESVMTQIYPHWELCIADDASDAPHVAEILRKYAKNDVRVRVEFRPTNGHISAASNSALAMATGEYIALLDHDDLLSPHALAMMVKYLNANPSARLLYSDEDKISIMGRRHSPYFKSDWDPELIIQQNFFCHLGVFETQLVRDIGGFRIGFEGSQDHDLVLRCARVAGDVAVVHVPHVLYHWRSIAGSTATGIEQKPYAIHAGMDAAIEHLDATSSKARMLPPTASLPFMTIDYSLPERYPTICVVVEAQEDAASLSQCLLSLLDYTDYPAFRVIVVARKDMMVMPDMQRRLSYVCSDAAGLSTLINQVIRECDDEYICLLNQNIRIIEPDWLQLLMKHALRPGIGLVGAKLCRPNGDVWASGLVKVSQQHAVPAHAGIRRSDPGYFGLNMLTRCVSALPMVGILIRRSSLLLAGGIPEYLGSEFNRGVDLSGKLTGMGLRHILVPSAVLECVRTTQVRRKTKRASQVSRSEIHFKDGTYNPNLSLNVSSAAFNLSFPPRIGKFE